MRTRVVFRIVVTALSICASVRAVEAQPGQHGYERALEDVRARIRARTGPGGQSCGDVFRQPDDARVHTAAEVREAIACVRRHASVGEPTWFVLGGHGLDSWVAEGLLASPYGAIERYTYDSDPGGGGSVSDAARFDSGQCFWAHVYERPNQGFNIECLNDQWRLVAHAVLLSIFAIATTIGLILTRLSWLKWAATVQILGVVLTIVGAGTLARLGGLRADLGVATAACLLVMGVVLRRCMRSPISLAA